MDAARTAKRLGAEVHIVYRRARKSFQQEKKKYIMQKKKALFLTFCRILLKS